MGNKLNLSRFLGRVPVAQVEPVRARLYRKERCGLCLEALSVLRPFEQAGRLIVVPVDITGDAELFRRYSLSIPVLELASGQQLAWPFDQAELRRALR